MWPELSAAERETWQDYARRLTERRRSMGLAGVRQTPAVFSALTAKFQQASPGLSPPRAAPSSEFLGDSLVVTAYAPVVGAVEFEADTPNESDVTTELLLQPLASPVRTPRPLGYRHRAFFRFELGSLTATEPAGPGPYPAAVRFLRASTGQASVLMELGTVVVD